MEEMVRVTLKKAFAEMGKGGDHSFLREKEMLEEIKKNSAAERDENAAITRMVQELQDGFRGPELYGAPDAPTTIAESLKQRSVSFVSTKTLTPSQV